MDTRLTKFIHEFLFLMEKRRVLTHVTWKNIETSHPLKMGNKKAPPPRMPQIKERALARALFLDSLPIVLKFKDFWAHTFPFYLLLPTKQDCKKKV